MKNSAWVLALLFVIGLALTWFVIPTRPTSVIIPSTLEKEAFEYAQANLPKEGRLMIKPDGFVYLKVDDAYIRTLFPMLELKKEGFREPPYFRRPHAPGAHISVFYANERIKPEELGQIFHFELKDIDVVRTTKDSMYALLQVEAPELEKLRLKYGLSPKLHGHKFHITIGKKDLRHYH